jgi:hypothetical protein
MAVSTIMSGSGGLLKNKKRLNQKAHFQSKRLGMGFYVLKGGTKK